MQIATKSRTDVEVQQAVEAELSWDPAIENADDIYVSVHHGVVTLTGSVKSYWQKLAAERAVRSLAGVRAVANDIQVLLTGAVNDTEVATTAAQILEANALLKNEDVDVSVRSGIVTLSGHVSWEYQRRAAEKSLAHVRGVIAITNAIEVTSPVKIEADIRKGIRAAFERNASIDADKINVAFDHGRVHLTGTAATYQDKWAATRAAWRAPGVTSVKNDIDVD